MPTERTGSGERAGLQDGTKVEHVTISEGTRFDLKTGIILAGVIVSGALAWGEQKLALFRQESVLRAEIIAVKTETEKAGDSADRVQDARITATENRMENILATVCAIAAKNNVTSSGCK